jgi:hypothetical protein
LEGDEKIGKEASMRRRRTVVHFVGHWREAKPFQMMERETRIEPATNSLEEHASIINKDNGVFGGDSTLTKPPKTCILK